MPLVSDELALVAFKKVFGVTPTVRKEAAQIRLGKIAIALNELKRAIQFAQDCGVSSKNIGILTDKKDELVRQMADFAKQTDPDMKEMEELKNRSRELETKLQDAIAKLPLPTLSDSGVCAFDVPGIDKLSTVDRTAKIDEVRGKVCRGSALTGGVLRSKGSLAVGPSKETVADMCWYLKGMAQKKHGGPYQDGALTLEDEDGALAKFFDSCPDAYPRKSSHLRPEQRGEGSQGRGIDIPGGFPGDMNTVLWHPYVDETGKKRIYIKFEPAGSHGFVDEGKREVARRPENENDSEEAWQHTLSFLGVGKKPNVRKIDMKNAREGTIDCGVLNAYQELVSACPGDYKYLLEAGKQASKQNSEGKVTGFSRARSFIPLIAKGYWDVKTQNTNINNALDEMQNKDRNRAAVEHIFPYVIAWRKAMKTAGYIDDTESRIGDEVSLSTGDLSTVTGKHGDSDVGPGALIPAIDLCKRQIGLQAVLLQGNHDNLLFTYYAKLTFPKPGSRLRPEVLYHVLLLDTHAPQFADYVDLPTHMVMGSIKKSSKFKRKSFEYTGNVSQAVMFDMLKKSGWPMANLTTPQHLIKNG